jgi:hypothetical protein
MISRRALEDAMTVAAREHELIGSYEPPSPDQVLALYRQLREVERANPATVVSHLSDGLKRALTLTSTGDRHPPQHPAC